MKPRLLVAFSLLASAAAFGQIKNPEPPPQPLERAEGERQARPLVARLLAQKPAENSTNTGLVRIRGTNREWRALPAHFEIQLTPTNFSTIYKVTGSDAQPESVLTITHTEGQPNRYFLGERASKGVDLTTKELTGAQLMTPFAGSDFCAADLGLEFLHWPSQRILKKEFRNHVFCSVLQSTNPDPGSTGYSRVESWIGTDHPEDIALAHADAYDASGKRLKQFEPKELKKVNGAYQLESMEMLNNRLGTATVIEFNLATTGR
jgi:hypothetical protein